MTWNNIVDGQPGLALPAMQNWRHAGRFNGDMIPLDTNGITSTAGTFNLGTANAPWANLYLATGSAIYIGGTEFEGGAGGGSSSIEVLEQQAHIEKMGYSFALSSNQSCNESFVKSDAMILTLGKTHLNTETSIYLDRDASTISAINTTTGWTTGGTGTAAANATAGESVNGTSIKYSVTGTNTTYYIKSSFTTFNLIDKNLKVWLYPDAVTNITAAMIRLYTAATTTGYAEWRIAAASLTAATLNSIVLNIDSPDTSGADYTRASINEVYLGHVGSATPQAINWSWNYLRSVNNKELKLPLRIPCDNNTNQEFINIISVTVAGDKYLLDTTTTYSHTISSTELKLKQLDIANNQGEFPSGAAGDAALTAWDIKRQYLNTNTSGDLVISSRWYDESYQVATLTSASVTVLSITTSTVKDGFKSGDIVRLYKWEYIDNDYQSPINASLGSNFLDLTLTADATATSSLLTLVHGNTSNQNLGGDTVDKWRGVRVSADDYYRVESATASQALVKATPTIWIPKNTGISYDSVPNLSAHWKFEQDGGTTQLDSKNNYTLLAVGTPTKVQGKFGFAASGFVSNTAYYRNFHANFNITAGASTIQTIDCWVKFVGVGDNVDQILFGNTTSGYSARTSDAICFYLVASSNNLAIGEGGGATNCTTNVSTYNNDGLWHHVVGIIDNTSASGTRKWIYVDGVSVGSIENTQNGWTAADGYIVVGSESGETRSWKGSIDDMAYYNGYAMTSTEISQRYASGIGKEYENSLGYIQKSTIPTVSGSKLITATRLTRQDATNQRPIVYQRNAVII